MRQGLAVVIFAALGLMEAAAPAPAQSTPESASPAAAFPPARRIDPIKSKDEIPLYPAGAPKMPGAMADERWNAIGENPVVRNVVVPTLRPYLPAASKANGTAVLVAPGGGFMMLAMKEEGWDVAQWLADQGRTKAIGGTIAKNPSNEKDWLTLKPHRITTEREHERARL